MNIETERLILRQIEEKDVKNLVEQINNLNISKWLLVVPYPYTIEDAKWYINHIAEKYKEEPQNSYDFALEIKKNPGLIGGMSISNIDYDQGTAELGYWIGQNYWRKGYASEGVKAMINYAFNKLNLRRLSIPAFSTNKGSNGLAKSLGFTFEGCMREAAKCKATGKIHDENLWSLLRKEWKG